MKQKFQSLFHQRTPTSNLNCPAQVQLVKKIQKNSKAKTDIDDDDGDDDDKENDDNDKETTIGVVPCEPPLLQMVAVFSTVADAQYA